MVVEDFLGARVRVGEHQIGGLARWYPCERCLDPLLTLRARVGGYPCIAGALIQKNLKVF